MIYAHGDFWRDNGFQSVKYMKASFDQISGFLKERVDKEAPHILDTRCRNGALLRHLMSEIPGMVPWGMEQIPDFVEKAAYHCFEYPENFALVDWTITPWPVPKVDVALVSPGRLTEVPEGKLETVLRELDQKADKIIAYVHNSWVRGITLEEFCGRVGLEVVAKREKGLTFVAEVVVSIPDKT